MGRRRVNMICSLESRRLVTDTQGCERLSRLGFGAALWSGLWIGEPLRIPHHASAFRCLQDACSRHSAKLLCNVHRLLHNQLSSSSPHLTTQLFLQESLLGD